jgi:hypothetical protein
VRFRDIIGSSNPKQAATFFYSENIEPGMIMGSPLLTKGSSNPLD